MYSFNIWMSEMKKIEIVDENSPKKQWRDWENSSTYWKFEIVSFEMPNEFIGAVTKSAEGTEEKVRYNESSR